MLRKKDSLWSHHSCHPGRPGNLVICSNTSCCQTRALLRASGGEDEAVISHPAAMSDSPCLTQNRRSSRAENVKSRS